MGWWRWCWRPDDGQDYQIGRGLVGMAGEPFPAPQAWRLVDQPPTVKGGAGPKLAEVMATIKGETA